MKKILFLVVLVVMCMGLFAQAQFTPYGSARVGYWYEMQDEYWTGTGESRMRMNLDLQGNSRFGVNFRNGDLTANVEFGYQGGDGHVRHLWAKQSFGNWSLLAGFTEDGTNEGAGQVAFNDNMLRNGFGAVYGGRNPMIRFEMDNGFYAALIQPDTDHDPAGNPGGVDALIPRINAGWRFNIGDVKIHPTVAFQMYQYNEDHGIGNEGDVMSVLGAITAHFDYSVWDFKLHFNFGLNAQQMGYDVPFGATWIAADDETEDLTSLGGFATVGYYAGSGINLGLGIGFAQFDHDLFDDAWQNLAVYFHAGFRLQENLRIIPEFGYLIDGMQLDDPMTNIYFGTQLRLDF